ncbi:MAG: class I SAM-dependent methyltransferase [Myxococcota bacterium]|nr:class I SAM-dependent methyltransferase [Myxococcota bacterium]
MNKLKEQAERPIDKKLDNQLYYDKFASWYERERGAGYHRFIDELELSLIREACRGAEVLELGCGTGLLLSPVASIARRAVGVDLSPGMLEKAKERGLDVHLADVTSLPFEDESFDVVYSFKVLAHVPELSKALSEAARVLRPGGRAFLEFYNRHSVRYWAKRLGGAGAIAEDAKESDVYVKWQGRRELLATFPSSLQVEGMHGVRVFTPAAFVHRIPVISAVLQAAERAALSHRLFSRWGGFLVVEARKR